MNTQNIKSTADVPCQNILSHFSSWNCLLQKVSQCTSMTKTTEWQSCTQFDYTSVTVIVVHQW